MQRSMPKTRQQLRKEQALESKLRAELRKKGITRHSQREKLMRKAAAGRPSDIRQQALKSLAARRVQKSIDSIAGRTA